MRFAKTDFLLGVMICAAAFLTFIQTVNFLFVPFSDAICFLPQTVKLAQGEGLRNVYVFVPNNPRRAVQGRYLYEGFRVFCKRRGFRCRRRFFRSAFLP